MTLARKPAVGREPSRGDHLRWRRGCTYRRGSARTCTITRSTAPTSPLLATGDSTPARHRPRVRHLAAIVRSAPPIGAAVDNGLLRLDADVRCEEPPEREDLPLPHADAGDHHDEPDHEDGHRPPTSAADWTLAALKLPSKPPTIATATTTWLPGSAAEPRWLSRLRSPIAPSPIANSTRHA